MYTVALDETALAFEDSGPRHGLPLLLVHGHRLDGSMWGPQVRRFAAERRVITPDLRGHGASTGTVRDWSDLADDLVALLDVLGEPAAVVAGQGMGGQVALELHRCHPDRVAGLLLCGTGAAADPDPAARRAAGERLVRDGTRPSAGAVVDGLLLPAATPEVREHVLAMVRTADTPGAAAAHAAAADRPDYRPHLATAAVPATVVVGAADAHTPLAEARATAAALDGGELVVVRSAAHLPNLEHPTAFDAALTRLLLRAGAHRCPGEWAGPQAVLPQPRPR